jgi:hypothetical protein
MGSSADRGAVFGTPKLHLELDDRAPVTAYGGVALVEGLLRRVGAAEVIDGAVHVLARHHPYHESDHVIALALNLMIGGECIEDMALLQHDQAMLRILGAERSPDPTTAGDFLRRFGSDVHPGALDELRYAVDTVQDRVWEQVRRRRPRALRRLGHWGYIDLDSHVTSTYATQKSGADFSYNGQWGFHPLIVSLANTGEILDLVQRPGNAHSATGVADTLDRVLPQTVGRYGFRNLLVRGDSAFDQAPVRAACERHGAAYALVAKEVGAKPRHAESLAEEDWTAYMSRSRRRRLAKKGGHSRTRGINELDRKVTQRRYAVKRKAGIEVAEVPYQPTGSHSPARLIIRRERLENRTFDGQWFLFREEYEFRYIVTNLPHAYSADQVVDLTYERCDQENIIEQFRNGIAGWHAPVREFDGNAAHLQIARLAWNLGKAIAILALPEEAIRWEWKRLRRTVFLIAAAVTRRSRQTWIRISASHLHAQLFVTAHNRLCT